MIAISHTKRAVFTPCLIEKTSCNVNLSRSTTHESLMLFQTSYRSECFGGIGESGFLRIRPVLWFRACQKSNIQESEFRSPTHHPLLCYIIQHPIPLRQVFCMRYNECMSTITIPVQIQDPINAAILAVSEDKIQGFLADPLGAIASASGIPVETVIERIQGLLRAGVIRRVRQTLMATNLAQGALVAWQVPVD